MRALGPDAEDTLVVFLSDNGYLQGEHRVPLGKLEVYEESSRVPIMLRGPGVPAGVVDRAVVSNVDVASTIVEATESSRAASSTAPRYWRCWRAPPSRGREC